MQRLRPLRRFWWVLLPLALAALLLRERHALAAVLVDWSDFSLVQGVYFSPGVTAAERSRLFADLERARARVAAFYGPLRAKPTFVVAEAARLARFAPSKTAATHYLPSRAITVTASLEELLMRLMTSMV